MGYKESQEKTVLKIPNFGINFIPDEINPLLSGAKPTTQS